MKKFLQEFKTFALRGNVMDMAVGVLIGGAFSGIVASLTDNFIQPVINAVTGAASYTLTDVAGFASAFVSAVFSFFITALVLFFLLKGINGLMGLGRRKNEGKPAAPSTKKCPYCLSEIPLAATRCAHCTSLLTDPDAAAQPVPGVNKQ